MSIHRHVLQSSYLGTRARSARRSESPHPEDLGYSTPFRGSDSPTETSDPSLRTSPFHHSVLL